MPVNYVKFMRGSVAAYNKLKQKDDDTLYFLSDKDNTEGYLYLGTKLISEPGSGSLTNLSLSSLQDVLITQGLNYDAILMYDSKEGKWRDYSFDTLVFKGATEDEDGWSGFVPTPLITDKNLFLRGDGTWAPAGTVEQIFGNILTAVDETHEAAIVKATAGYILNPGDIAIVKDYIADGKYQNTSYVYNGSSWIAMDGNYNAENVYFKNDFTFTENVGTVVIPSSGSVIVEAEGKNVKQFFETLFAKEVNPTTIQPSVGIIASNNGLYEVGTSVTPVYEGTYNSGSYSFDTSTGVTASNWIATSAADVEPVLDEDASGNVIPNKGSFPSIIVKDDTNYWIKVQATLSDGNIPHTNLGNNYSDGQIKEAVYSATTTTNITGYRKTFWGTLANKEALTSDSIRELSSSSKAYSNGSTFTISVPIGAMRVVIAYPATLRNMTSVLDENDSNANIVSGFGDPMTIAIEGANDYDAINYKVYIMDFANPYDADNKFKVTI